MMKRLAVMLVLLGGCDMYFGGDDDPPPPCGYGTGVTNDIAPAQELRDPNTGTCQYVGNPPYPCDGTCGPCAYDATADGGTVAQPDWGSCYSTCEGLDQNSCLATAGCFAAFIDNTDNAPPTFWGCWQTAPSGPVEGGNCATLGAQECSRHDDCSATYNSINGYTKFSSCIAEPTTSACSDVACAPGYHCEQQCTAAGGQGGLMGACEPLCQSDLTCASVDCGPGYTCAETCTPDANGVTTCYPACVDTPAACETLQTESACTSRADCEPVYDGQNCTCTPYGCTCQVLTYERCQTHIAW